MMIKKILTSIFLVLGISIYSQVVINEIDADTAGTDELEFVELKSATPNFPLHGYILVFYNETNTSCYFALDFNFC